jgi:CelD/BcsL family acetyltransferase involved in cellulose biosynthesis
VSRVEDFLLLKKAWDELLEMSEFASVFLSHGWIRCFWDAWGSDKRLMILVARLGENLMGVAPLMLYNGKHLGVSAKILSFIENDESPHCDFVVNQHAHREVVSAFFDYITSMQNNWDILFLRKIPVDSPILEPIKACCERHCYKFQVRASLESPILRTDADWVSYYSQRSQRFKKRVRHLRNKLHRQGNILVQKSPDPDEIKSLLPEVFEVGASSWKQRGKNDIGSSSQSRTFFSDLPFALKPRGTVYLWSLRLGDQMIAFEYHVKDGQTVYALRAEFDEAHRTHGPGSVLDFEIVRGLFENNVTLYNMCGNPYPHKLRWTSETRSHVDILVFGHHPYGLLLAFLENTLKPLIKRALKYTTFMAPF